MNFAMIASSVISLIPAAVLLIYFFGKYEGYFLESRLFITFALGLLCGFVASIFNFFIRSPSSGVSILWFSLYVILFALFGEFSKLIILNMKRFAGRFDTTFYGGALGTGYGCMYSMSVAFISLSLSELSFVSGMLKAGALLIISFSFCFFHAGIGILIGYGAFKKNPYKYMMYAVPLDIFFIILNLGFSYLPAGGATIIIAVLTFAYAMVVFRKAFVKLLPSSLPAELRRFFRKQKPYLTEEDEHIKADSYNNMKDGETDQIALQNTSRRKPRRLRDTSSAGTQEPESDSSAESRGKRKHGKENEPDPELILKKK